MTSPSLAQNSEGTASARGHGPGRPFAKGVSGNPGGRPPDVGHIRELAKLHTAEALETLVAVMRTGTPDRARAAAAEALLDRGWGRPEQGVELSGSVTSITYKSSLNPNALRVPP